MWLTFTNMCLLVGNLKRYWEQEIANYDESMRAPFRPFKNSPPHVDYGSFVAEPGQLEITMRKKDVNSYYETVVKNTLQNSAVRRSGKQIFYLGTTAAIDLQQTFEIGTTEYSPKSRRLKDSLFKLKAIVDLRLCINLDTAEVSIFYHHWMYA